MKRYDFNVVMSFLENNDASLIETIEIGMIEDWGWTSETVFEGGKLLDEYPQTPVIAGISGSSWATPTMVVTYADGEEFVCPCHDNGESREMNREEAQMYYGTGGRPR